MPSILTAMAHPVGTSHASDKRAHHAFYAAGDREEGIAAALSFLETERGLGSAGNPDVIVERHQLFSVDDARRVERKAALAAVGGKEKALVIAADRLFHEAQNALLKVLEEPSEGTTIILVVPAVGTLLATVRSRVQPLPGMKIAAPRASEESHAFWEGTPSARGKIVEAILKESKSDDEDDKARARTRARELAEGLAVLAHKAWREGSKTPHFLLLEDLNRLIPVLYDRSAPLKPILEHILITAPKA